MENLTNEQISNKLTFMAMLGESIRETYKKEGIDLDDMFEKCMDNAKDIENPLLRFQTAMSEYKIEFLKLMPLENRCNFILNSIDKIKDDSENFDESNINWDKINDILFKNPLEYDYNLYDSVHSMEELSDLVYLINESYYFDGPWYRQKCKTCGTSFTLTRKEVEFYIKKGLHVPKRCKNCILESKGKESPRQAEQKRKKEMENVRKQLTYVPEKTAMQIAFEKANNKKKG